MKVLNYRIRHAITATIRGVDIRGSAVISNAIARALMPRPTGTLAIRTRHKFNLIIDPLNDSGVERALYHFGTYEEGILSLMRFLLQQGDIFVDVGANIGLMSIHASLIVGETGQVYAFEAHPGTLQILKANIGLNYCRNVTVFGDALGAARSVGTIYSNWHINRGGASLIESDADGEGFDVHVERFDEVFPEELKSRIALVKVDIEGYELEALRGFGDVLRSTDAPMLIVECSDQTDNGTKSSEALIRYLVEINNYQAYKLAGGKERKSRLMRVGKTIPTHDNLLFLLPQHRRQLNANLFI